MNEQYRSAFTKLIVEPLERVVSKPLETVTCYVLQCDYLGFDGDNPNTSGGCQGIHLSFAGGEVELDWDGQDVFKPTPADFASEPTAYHIVARPISMRRSAVRTFTDDESDFRLDVIDATKAHPWKDLDKQLLQGVDVWGFPLPEGRYSPQAVKLSFSCAQIIICIGMSEFMSIGDGDEVLVFTEQEWARKLSKHPCDWLVSFWSSARR